MAIWMCFSITFPIYMYLLIHFSNQCMQNILHLITFDPLFAYLQSNMWTYVCVLYICSLVTHIIIYKYKHIEMFVCVSLNLYMQNAHLFTQLILNLASIFRRFLYVRMVKYYSLDHQTLNIVVCKWELRIFRRLLQIQMNCVCVLRKLRVKFTAWKCSTQTCKKD